MCPADSRQAASWLCFPSRVGFHPPDGPPRFLDQSFGTRCLQPPRLLPTAAYARSSPPATGFPASGTFSLTAFSVTRSNRVHLRYGSRLRLRRLRRSDCSEKNTPLPWLHAVRAIHMTDSFQSVRLTRLILALQRRRGRRENIRKNRHGGTERSGRLHLAIVRKDRTDFFFATSVLPR
jgi:hypothetical protein